MSKSSGCLGGVAVIAVLPLLAFSLLFGSCEKGFGFGKGSGNGQNTDSNSVTTAVTDETIEDNTTATNDNVTVVAITVMESDYIFQNNKIELDDFIAELTSVDGKKVVEITDSNSSLKAYRKLISALEENHIEYTEQ